MAATLWRSEPQYRGEVADGYYQAADGRLRYRPLPSLEQMRRRLDELIGEPVAPVLCVSAHAIGGRLPTAEQVESVRRELHKAPAKVLADFREHNGSVEVVPKGRAGDHHVARLLLPNWRGFGFCSQGPGCAPLIVVEGGEDTGTTLHELGHFVDRENRFSRLPEWRRLAAAATRIADYSYSLFDSDGPLAHLHNARRNPNECFCEAFAVCFYSPRTRSHLSAEMQRFIKRVTA